MSVVEGGPAVSRAGDAGVADVAAPARVVAVVDEDRLALVLLLERFYIQYLTERKPSQTQGLILRQMLSDKMNCAM